MRLYEKLGRTLYYIIDSVYKFIPVKNPRTRCLIINDNEVLLVKNWVGRNEWTLPGGGKRPKESSEKSIKREVFEELSIKLDEVEDLGYFSNERKGAHFDYELFKAEVDKKDFKRRKSEISNASWFKLSSLPKLKTLEVDEAINRYKEPS